MEYSPSKLASQASLLIVSPAHPYVRHAFVTVLRTFRMLIKSNPHLVPQGRGGSTQWVPPVVQLNHPNHRIS
eukprot:jgi/Botrbrau1/7610/Bobra.0159s0059.1